MPLTKLNTKFAGTHEMARQEIKERVARKFYKIDLIYSQ